MSSLRFVLIALLVSSCNNKDEPVFTPQNPELNQPSKTPQSSVERVEPQKGASNGAGLAQARAGFKTEVVKRPPPYKAPDKPPANLFTLTQYDSAVGKLTAYVSPDPKDGKKHPAIIWITGGDCNSIDDGSWKPAAPQNDQSAKSFRENGIIMMFPTLRGGNNSTTKKEGFFGEIDDVVSAQAHLAALPYVDATRIYLGGHSTGGTTALLAAELSPKFRAVLSLGPIDEVERYGPDYVIWNFRNRRESELRDPIRWLGSIQSPTFVLEGERDGNDDSLLAMKNRSQNPLVHFHVVARHDHFTLVHPVTQMFAKKILADTGEKVNITITDADLQQLGDGVRKKR